MRNLILAVTLAFLTACTAQDLQGIQDASGHDGAADSNTPTAIACDTQSQPFGGGSGTTSDPWLICTAAQLRNVGAYDHDSFKLMDDIGMNKLNAQLQPVATAGLGNFYGTFDGNGHVIGGLWTKTGYGLFDTIYGTVKNLELRYMNVQCPDSGCGVLAGMVATGGSVDDINIHDSQVTGYQSVGGAVGDVWSQATRMYVWTTTVTAGSLNSGGLVGRIEAGAVVSGNSASGGYSASQQRGFVVGLLGGALTCINQAGRAWATNNTIGINFGSGTSTGCL